jgi:hypothetical protein
MPRMFTGRTAIMITTITATCMVRIAIMAIIIMRR